MEGFLTVASLERAGWAVLEKRLEATSPVPLSFAFYRREPWKGMIRTSQVEPPQQSWGS